VNIYVAAPWIHKDAAAQFAAQCQARGYTITRKWWEYEAGDEEVDVLQEQAIADFDAVAAADAVVVLQIAKSEGKAAETGYAIAQGIPVIAHLGGNAPGNIFHHHPGVMKVHTQNEVFTALNAIQLTVA
jgi:nucleoside 2-deoxyribosyltransferase